MEIPAISSFRLRLLRWAAVGFFVLSSNSYLQAQNNPTKPKAKMELVRMKETIRVKPHFKIQIYTTEKGLANVTLQLMGDSSDVIYATKTDSTGWATIYYSDSAFHNDTIQFKMIFPKSYIPQVLTFTRNELSSGVVYYHTMEPVKIEMPPVRTRVTAGAPVIAVGGISARTVLTNTHPIIEYTPPAQAVIDYKPAGKMQILPPGKVMFGTHDSPGVDLNLKLDRIP